MKASDWAIVFATFFGPVLAVQAQKWIERLREKRNRQDLVFRTIMTTRANQLSFDHVRALNMIPLEFSNKGNKVMKAWKVYLDHLNGLGHQPSPEKIEAWASKGEDLFCTLLETMAKELKYDFDLIELKRGAYNPKAHGELEQMQLFIQRKLADILAGTDSFPMKVMSVPVDPKITEQQIQLNEKLVRYLDGQAPVRVKIEKENS